METLLTFFLGGVALVVGIVVAIVVGFFALMLFAILVQICSN